MRRQLIQDTLTYGSADFIFKLIGFAALPIYTHLFSVEEFAIIAMLPVMMGLIGLAINLGVNNAVGRFYWDPETKDEHHALIVSSGIYQLLTVGFVVIFIIYFALTPIQGLLFTRYGIEWNLLVLALLTILPDQILQYALDTIRLHFTPVRFMILSFMKNIMGVALGLFLIVSLDTGLYGFFGGALLASVLAVPLALWFIRKELVWQFDKEVAHKIFRFGYPFVFAGLAYWIFGSMDRWMLAELSNTAEVGLYSIAFKFAAVVTFVNGAFSQAWSPYAVKLMRDNENYRQIYSNIFSVWFFILATLGFIITLFSSELLMLLTPKEYWPAAPTMGVVAMGVVLFGTTQVTALGISLEKKTHLLTHGAWLTALVNFLLNLALIPMYGAIGAALATLISYAVLTSFFLYWTQKLHPLPLESRKLVYSSCIILVGLALPLFFHTTDIGAAVIATKLLLLGPIVYGAWLLGIVDNRWLRLFASSRI